MNPAFGFAVNFTMLIDGQGAKTSLRWIWLYLTMPVLGSVLAVLFFVFVYKSAIK